MLLAVLGSSSTCVQALDEGYLIHGNGERVTSDATRSQPPAESGIAAARMLWIRIGAERSQLRFRIRRADHREGARFVFAVERSELGGVIRREPAVFSVFWIVEPKTYMKRVGWLQCYVRIEAEDLVEQDRLDANMAVVGLIADLDIRLVPGETEAALEDAFEVWIRRFIRQERAALYRKEIKGKTRLESIEIQNQSVIEFASNDRRPGPGLFIRRFAKATDHTRIWYQIKTDFIFLVLRRGRGWKDTPHYRRCQSEDDCAHLQAVPVLCKLIPPVLVGRHVSNADRRA